MQHFGSQTALSPEAPSASVVEQAIASNADRLPGDADRDSARHPAELIAFLGLTPNMTVAEVNPGVAGILAFWRRTSGAEAGMLASNTTLTSTRIATQIMLKGYAPSRAK